MKKVVKKKQVRKPTATSLGTPIFHRRRRDWRDDQYLIEDILKHIDSNIWVRKNTVTATRSFKKLASEIETLGYQSNEKAFSLAIWTRENLANLAAENGGYDLRVHALEIPKNIYDLISNICTHAPIKDSNKNAKILVEDLFPDPETRTYVLERIQMFHKGNLFSYLHYLVNNERVNLSGESATIMDLIQVCEEKLRRRNLKIVSNFNANQVDIWVPAIGLGIEIRDTLSVNEREDLISLLNNTNSLKKTKYLVIICPDNLSDLIFYGWREIERCGIVPNLSVVRIGDFGQYLDQLENVAKPIKS